MRDTLGSLFVGVAFGLVMSRIGFTSWDLVHEMFTFTGFHLLLVFMSSVVALVIGWQVIARLSKPNWSKRKMHKGTIAGGALFGVGWAITGGCPTIAWTQLGEGQLAAIWTILGIFLGNALYAFLHPRVFGWSTHSCLDD